MAKTLWAFRPGIIDYAFECCVLLTLQIFRTFANSTINISELFMMSSFLWIVKTAVFTGLYLGLWCEHSVETNTRAGDQLEQHSNPFVSELYKIKIDGLSCCVENHTFLLGHD